MKHEPLAAILAHEHLLVTSRGTAALWLLLSSLELDRKGVLVPVNVCEVVIAAILYAGLEPIYVDVDPVSGNCDVDHLERSHYQRAGVLLAVHNFGTPLPIDETCRWAGSRGLFVIEDVCNALGATSGGQEVGHFGDAAIYSFGHNKIVDVGQGGALAVRNRQLFEQCNQLNQTLLQWGEPQRRAEDAFQDCLRTIRRHSELKDPVLYNALYQQYRPALLTRATVETEAAVSNGVQTLAENLEIRNKRARYYRETLVHPRIVHRDQIPGEVCWRYTCHLPSGLRAGAIAHLLERKLPISIWYPAVDRLFRQRTSDHSYPGGDQFEETVINLWVAPSFSDDLIERTADALLSYLEDAAS